MQLPVDCFISLYIYLDSCTQFSVDLGSTNVMHKTSFYFKPYLQIELYDHNDF